MREMEFREFLERGRNLTDKAIASRMARARKAEGVIGTSLDAVVSDDDAMYDALVKLGAQEDPAHSSMQNAVRKYYIFTNDREFPQLRYYKR